MIFLREQGLLGVLLVALTGIAQSARPGSPTANASNSQKLAPEQKFVLDTVRTAVGLAAPDPQDRLRVLANAADLVSTIDRSMAKSLWREGARIESELILTGKKPVVSMMSSGQTDCGAAQSFVENLPPDAVLQAEQSLIGAVTSCAKQTLDTVSRKLDAALEKNVMAPRALMAAMEAQGTKTPWSQSHFESAFKSLPDPQANAGEAENVASLYSRMAGEVDKTRAEKAGLQLLSWLGKLNDTPERARAIRITTLAMQQALGAERYKQALQSDVSANAAAQNAGDGDKQRNPRNPGQATSVLNAMRDNGSDQSDRLRDLPPSERAREAAAHGFAAGTNGDKRQAGKYFDMAFAAADDVWETRNEDTKAVAVVQEVGEAAAQVDSLNALERAQRLRDPSAQAIAMLAVARVVASKGLATQAARPHH